MKLGAPPVLLEWPDFEGDKVQEGSSSKEEREKVNAEGSEEDGGKEDDEEDGV